MFSSGLKKIYAKINKLKGSKKKEAFLFLESQLMDNPALKYQFDLLNFVKRHKNSIVNQESFDKFVKGIKRKNVNFLKESRLSHSKIRKENKKLFEYYNINTNELVENQYDKAINISRPNSLNEVSFKKIFFVNSKKKNIFEDRKIFVEKLGIIKESFSNLLKTQDKKEFRKNFKIINYLSECMEPKTKQFVQTSSRSIFEKRQDFPKAANKLFKLRIACEKIIKEYEEDYNEWNSPKNYLYKNGKQVFDKNGQPAYKELGDKVSGEYGAGKSAKKTSLSYIDKISIEAPINKDNPDKIILQFSVKFYPTGITTDEARSSAWEFKQKVERLERDFLNQTIYQKDRLEYFNPVGTIWIAKLKLEQAVKGQEDRVNVTVYLHTSKKNYSFYDLENVGYDMIKDFNDLLPQLLGPFAFNLTPEAGKTKGDIKGWKIKNRINNRKAYLPIGDDEEKIDVGGLF